jgi:hypothetical protein
MENTEYSEKVMVCNDEIKSYLLVSSKWSKFLAIVGFVGMAIMMLIGLLMLVGLPFLSALSKTAPMWGIGVLYLLFGVMYYFPTLYLYRFSEKIKRGIQENDESILTDGFLNLKKMFKFVGIVMIVVLSMYALILVIAVPVALYLR